MTCELDHGLHSEAAGSDTKMNYFKFLAVLAVAGTEAFAADGSRRLVISLRDHKLALIEDGRAVKIYPVAIGKLSTPSPTGTFSLISRVSQPTWYGPRKVVGPGPVNPLGTRWMGLSRKGYGIHGTNAPKSIGKSASHGCIRMRKQDVEELFELVQIGDEVDLVRDPDVELAKIFQPYERSKSVPSPTSVENSGTADHTITGGGQ
jgi:lipoprotein-anchoring transpeptidase ErfK/SrfK